MKRATVRVAVPCVSCRLSGACLIEPQIEQDLTLAVIDVGRPLELSLSCSWYEADASAPRVVEMAEARSAKASKAARARWAHARNAPEHREAESAG